MEIAILIVLFLVGTVASAIQAMRYLERRQQRKPPEDAPRRED
jgi:hypothetical protein